MNTEEACDDNESSADSDGELTGGGGTADLVNVVAHVISIQPGAGTGICFRIFCA
jgi:hypothetical protein